MMSSSNPGYCMPTSKNACETLSYAFAKSMERKVPSSAASQSVSAHSEKSQFLKGPCGALHFEMVAVTHVWENNVFSDLRVPSKFYCSTSTFHSAVRKT